MSQFNFTTNADLLRRISPEAADGFQNLRRVIREAGPIDGKTRELIMLAGFVVARIESGFKVHAKIAVQEGATVEELEHMVLIGLSATQSLMHTEESLRWIREALADIKS